VVAKEITKSPGEHLSPFERIKRKNEAGMEFWSSRDIAAVLGYYEYRNFEGVLDKVKLTCFNTGYRVEDHFVDINDMIEVGKGGQRPVKTVLMSRYACYLAIQNADPGKDIVAQGQSYFALQTRRQELADEQVEEERRLLLREEMRRHNEQLAGAAREAGVIEPIDYAIFQNHGYMGFMAD
jgi:DNA-damage-inducible protein D